MVNQQRVCVAIRKIGSVGFDRLGTDIRLADSDVDAVDHQTVVLRGLLVRLVPILARCVVASTAALMASSLPVVLTVRGEIAHAFTNTVDVCLAVSTETLSHLSTHQYFYDVQQGKEVLRPFNGASSYVHRLSYVTQHVAVFIVCMCVRACDRSQLIPALHRVQSTRNNVPGTVMACSTFEKCTAQFDGDLCLEKQTSQSVRCITFSTDFLTRNVQSLRVSFFASYVGPGVESNI